MRKIEDKIEEMRERIQLNEKIISNFEKTVQYYQINVKKWQDLIDGANYNHIEKIQPNLQEDFDTLTSILNNEKINLKIVTDFSFLKTLLLDIEIQITEVGETISSSYECSGILFDKNTQENTNSIKKKEFKNFITARHCLTDSDKADSRITFEAKVIAKNEAGIVFQKSYTSDQIQKMVHLNVAQYEESRDDFVAFELDKPVIVTSSHPFIFQNFIKIDSLKTVINDNNSIILMGGYLTLDEKFQKDGAYFVQSMEGQKRPMIVTQLMEKNEIGKYFKEEAIGTNRIDYMSKEFENFQFGGFAKKGMSGGPMFVKTGNKITIVGLLASGDTSICAFSRPSFSRRKLI